jgi:hypothetical protein
MSDRDFAARAASEEEIPEEILFSEEELAHADRRDAGRRHATMWLAVLGTMAFVAALWFFLLPTQFGAVKTLGPKSAAAWSAPTNADDSVESFKASLNGIRDQLDRAEAAQKGQITTQDAVSAETAKLRANIEAAANKNAPPPTNAPTK